MRVVITLLVLIVLTGAAAYSLREGQPGVSQVLLGFSILLTVLFVAAFFNFV